MGGLLETLDRVKAVLNETNRIQPSNIAFSPDRLPDTLRHGSYRLMAGAIQSNETGAVDGAGTLCSEKNRQLSILIAVKNNHNDQQIYEDLVELEELVESRLLKDARTASDINALQNVETSAEPGAAFWTMEMSFDFDYRREF